MKDELATTMAALGNDSDIQVLLARVCDLTGMGFAAVAHVSDSRWIACQVNDRVAFGLKPGDELEIKKTICDEIRESGQAIAIEDTAKDPDWWNHPVPILYGFHSYISLPIMVANQFFGTLCAIDDAPRERSFAVIIDELQAIAGLIAARLERNRPVDRLAR